MSFSKSDIADLYPLSPLQESMLLHARLHPESRAYFEQRCYRLSGPLAPTQLRAAFNELLARHGVLRTIFVAEKGKRPLQIVLKPREVPWEELDYREMSPAEQQAALAQLQEADRERGVDCTRELPLRVTLVALAEQSFALIWSMHHIVVDGWSSAILYAELLELYQARLKGTTPRLAPVVPFARYISWLESLEPQESLAFWQQELAGYRAPALLPGLRRREERQRYLPQQLSVASAAGTATALAALAARWQVTVGTVIHTLWGVLLGWYNHSDDVVFATVVSGRPDSLEGARQLVGLCINTVPVRLQIEPGQSLAQLAAVMQQRAGAAAAHHFSSLAEIQNLTPLKRDLLNHLVAVENFPRPAKDAGANPLGEEPTGLTIAPSGGHEQIDYDLALVVVPGEPLAIELHYNSLAYDPAAVGRIGGHFQQLLQAVVAKPELGVAEIAPLSSAEEQQLDEINRSACRPVLPGELAELFHQRVAAAPEHPAVVDSQGPVSYRELELMAAAVAEQLQTLPEFAPGAPVAVLLGRNRWLPAAFWAVLGAGGSYLPLDPATPAARVAAILKESGCRLLLTRSGQGLEQGWEQGKEQVGEQGPEQGPERGLERLWGEGVRRVDLDRLPVGRGGCQPPLPLGPRHPAYLIFTSGSSGTPKGVVIEQHSLINFAAWFSRYYQLSAETRSTLFASPAFDASLLEMVPLLLSGGTLHCLEHNLVDGEALIEFYREREINLSWIPPLLCEELCQCHRGRLPADFRLLTGGERLTDAGDGAFRVFNNYGPTEATIVATAVEVSGGGRSGVIPIGWPVDNTEIWIFDHLGRRSAWGAVGELYLGGAGLARGYLNRDELNIQCFVPHPTEPGARLYRTGDLVRLTAAGLEFVGRIDQQLKLRGFRIEPAEIEQVLLRQPEVGGAVVVLSDEATGPVLTAMLLAVGQPPPWRELQARLRAVLPEYMVPARYRWLESFPLTVSGKVDRQALAQLPPLDPAGEGGAAAASPPAPLGAMESKLAAIWGEVLGLVAIERDDNFFALGGHSLSATRVASRVRRDLDLELPLRAIFDYPGLGELAAFLESQLEPGRAEKSAPDSSAATGRSQE